MYLVDEWSIKEMQGEFPDYRLTSFLAIHARSVEFVVIRVPDEKGNLAHAALVRRDDPGQAPSRGNLVKLRQESKWIDATG